MELLSAKTVTATMNEVFIDNNMIDYIKRYHIKFIKYSILRLFIFCYLYEQREESINDVNNNN